MVEIICIVVIVFVLGIIMLRYLDGGFCQHEYEEIKHFVIPSELDNVKENGFKPNTLCSVTRKYVTDYRCKKCGKIHRKVEQTKC